MINIRQSGTLVQRIKPLTAYIETHPISAFLAILLVGMIPRLIMLPTSGFSLDLSQHYA